MKLFLRIAVMIALCAALAAGFAVAETYGDFTYQVNEDNMVTITGYAGGS